MGQPAPGPGQGSPRILLLAVQLPARGLRALLLAASPTGTPTSPVIPGLSCSPTVWQCPKCKVWPVPAGSTRGGALPITPPARPVLCGLGGAPGTNGALLRLPLAGAFPFARRAATLPGLLSSCWAGASRVALGWLGTVRTGRSGAAGAGRCRGSRSAAAAAVGILALAPLGHVAGCLHVSFDLLAGHLAALLTAALLTGELLGLAPVAAAASLPQGSLAFAAHCRREGRDDSEKTSNQCECYSAEGY